MQKTPHPESKSIVLRSTHILLVKVVAANPTAWTPTQPGLRARKVDLSLHISQTLRGSLEPAPAPAAPVRVTVAQSGYAGELMMQPLPGVWSQVELSPGAELVIFASSDASRAEQIASEPACLRVVTAEPVLPGLRIAVKAEADHRSLERTLALAAPETSRLDPTFADYLWARHADAAMASQSEFQSLVAFAERPGLHPDTRQALLDGAYDLVVTRGDATPERARRLALTMSRVLLIADAADLHDNLIGTYLPNLLGITSGLPRQPASRVFEGHDADRRALDAFLRKRGSDSDTTQLLAWLGVK